MPVIASTSGRLHSEQAHRETDHFFQLQEWTIPLPSHDVRNLDPLPLVNNDHPSVLSFEMYALESGEPPSHTLNWKPLGFLSHIKCRTNGDRFPLSLWEVWFCSTLGVPIPALIGPSQWCACNAFHFNSFGDPLWTPCRYTKSSLWLHRFMIGCCTGVFIFKPFFVSFSDVGQMSRWSNGDVPCRVSGAFKQRVWRRREPV
jgi:hypothetical protein